MAQLLANIFGNGQDGDFVISSNTVDSPIDAAFTGSTGALTGSGTNASFAPGQAVLIHQSQGTGAGQWERNIILNYSAGTITFSNPLSYTYTTGAQILVLKQYRSITITNSVTWAAKAWNGTTGGILAVLCSGRITSTGPISASERGYRGGAKGNNSINADPRGQAGEGYPGLGATTFATNCYLANGNGGGGGVNGSSPQNAGAGGGGAHGANGTAGQTVSGSTAGNGGIAIGSADLGTMLFGGGGGGGQGNNWDGGTGGNGGGIVLLFSRFISSQISSGGGNGTGGNAGGGAGGSILLVTQTITLGTNAITANKGLGSTALSPNGGDGSVGRIAIARCSVTDSGITLPSYYDRGYQTYCGIVGRG